MEFFRKFGGLNVWNIFKKIIDLIFKWLWRYMMDKNIFQRGVIKYKYILSFITDVQELEVLRLGGIWKEMCKSVKKNEEVVEVVTDNIRKIVGNGFDIFFWFENQIGEEFLKDRFFRLFILLTNKYVKVVELCFCDGVVWRWVF